MRDVVVYIKVSRVALYSQIVITQLLEENIAVDITLSVTFSTVYDS